MTEKTKRISRRVRWAGLMAAAAIVLIVAFPFVFPTTTVRWIAGRAGLGAFSPEIGSASLSLRGQVVLHDVVLHERDDSSAVIVRVGKLQADFSWMEVVGSRFRNIRAEKVDVHVRRAGEAALVGGADALAAQTYNAATGAVDGNVELHNVHLTGGPGEHVRGLQFTGNVHGPITADFLQAATIDYGQLTFDSLAWAKGSVERFESWLELSHGVLECIGLKATFAGGDFLGLLQYDAINGRIQQAMLSVDHLDQKQVAANLAPDRLDAEGTVSGTVKLSAGKKSALKGHIDLASDGPGRLRIKDEAAARMLAQQLQVNDQSGLLPPNFSDIVVGQLKDYPYRDAKIRIADRDGTPVLSLDYTRESVKPGEPGYDVATTFQGKAIRANYTIQLPGVTVVLKGKTIDELLAEATGFAATLTQQK